MNKWGWQIMKKIWSKKRWTWLHLRVVNPEAASRGGGGVAPGLHGPWRTIEKSSSDVIDHDSITWKGRVLDWKTKSETGSNCHGSCSMERVLEMVLDFVIYHSPLFFFGALNLRGPRAKTTRSIDFFGSGRMGRLVRGCEREAVSIGRRKIKILLENQLADGNFNDFRRWLHNPFLPRCQRTVPRGWLVPWGFWVKSRKIILFSSSPVMHWDFFS